MILFGLVLLVVAVAAGYLIVLGVLGLPATSAVDVPVLGGSISLPPLALLITGAVIITLFWLGWVLLRAGFRRSSRRRKAEKEAQAQAEATRREEQARYEQESARHQRELEEQRARSAEETARLKAEADARVREQHLATETARRRAEVAESKLTDPGRPADSAQPGTDPEGPVSGPGR